MFRWARRRRQAAKPPQGENPGQWFAAYLHQRALLASAESNFHCDPACSRPGCQNQDLQVPVSLFDILAAAGHQDQPIPAIYDHHYSLGLLANGREDWLRMGTLRLKKPCPFFQNNLCSIYSIRPLPCILFPEYLANEGTFEENARKEYFQDYFCFHRPLLLSPERAKVMTKLKRMWERETLISSFFLFDYGHCHIDFSNLLEELSAAARSQRDAEERLKPLQVIPNQVLEHFFLQHMAQCHPFAGLGQKISYLETREGQAELVQWLQDDLLLQKLQKRGDDRALVFRFVKGKLQAKRRSLSHPESKCY